MFKKIFVFLLCFLCFSYTVLANDRYIYFIEDYGFDDLYSYKNIRNILDNSVQGLGIQRGGKCEFSYFKSILNKRPSDININQVPLYNGNDSIDNKYFKGFVEIDGTLYVPSKILVYGQTPSKNLEESEKIFVEHVQNIQSLDNELEKIQGNNDMEIIILSWNKGYRSKMEKYIMPCIYYNNKSKGIFYSESTRNTGILDYDNINDIISGDIAKFKIVEGDINQIYRDRINSLKNKKAFLTNYGICMGILTIINSILLIFKYKRIMKLSSLFVIVSPLAILIEPIFNLNGFNNKVAAICIISIIFSLCVKRRGIKWISIVFLTIIYFDALFFRLLLKNSLLSYEPALGARFYGIGNEFLGIIIAYILIYISNVKIEYSWWIWFINAAILLYDGGGSNFGGFLTCGVIGFYLSPPSIKILELLLTVILIHFANNHIGVFFGNLIRFNIKYIVETLFSKLYTIKRLLKMNIWTEVIIISILIYLFNLLKGRLKFNGNAIVFVISCILVVIFNDSGIVSCALIMMIYLNYIFYSLLLEEKDGIY